MGDEVATMDRIAEAVRSYRFNLTREDLFQEAFAVVLEGLDLPFEREASLGERGRIDFLVDGGLGIELKVKGSPSGVAEQVVRYCEDEKVKAVMLVTGRHRLGAIPEKILGKPVRVVSLWESML